LYSPTADLSAGKYYWHVSCSRNPELFSIIDSLRIDPTGIDKDVSRPVQPVHLLIKSVKGNNRIIISIDKSNEINGVKFYSVSGRLISVVMRTEKTMRLEIPRVGKGIYFADIITNRRIFRSKIILP
jgi:hypothetical protein